MEMKDTATLYAIIEDTIALLDLTKTKKVTYTFELASFKIEIAVYPKEATA